MITQQLNPSGRFDTWSQKRIEELHLTKVSTDVGTRLIYQDASIRVWQLHLKPAQRMPFHKHTTDYTWVALTAGHAVSYYGSGKVTDITYERGDVFFYHHSKEGDFVHDLENTGDTELVFSTVEYKNNFNRG